MSGGRIGGEAGSLVPATMRNGPLPMTVHVANFEAWRAVPENYTGLWKSVTEDATLFYGAFFQGELLAVVALKGGHDQDLRWQFADVLERAVGGQRPALKVVAGAATHKRPRRATKSPQRVLSLLR